MDILFRTKKLRKECSDSTRLVKRHGPKRAKLIRRRLDELAAVESLEDMRSLPQAHCHQLRANWAGHLSVDIDHPYRLIFRPTDDPPPTRPDGGLHWRAVASIEIVGVEDTHE